MQGEWSEFVVQEAPAWLRARKRARRWRRLGRLAEFAGVWLAVALALAAFWWAMAGCLRGGAA